MNNQEYDTIFVSNALNNIESDTMLRDFNKSTFFVRKPSSQIINAKSDLINHLTQQRPVFNNNNNNYPIATSAYATTIENKNATLDSPLRSDYKQVSFNNTQRHIDSIYEEDDDEISNDIKHTNDIFQKVGQSVDKEETNTDQIGKNISIKSSSQSSISSLSSSSSSSNNSFRSNNSKKRQKTTQSTDKKQTKCSEKLIKSKIEFYNKVTTIGIKVIQPIEALSSRTRWFNITGYSNELVKEQSEIARLLNEIDPFDTFTDMIISPHLQLAFVLCMPLAMIIYKNILTQPTNKPALDKENTDISMSNRQHNNIFRDNSSKNVQEVKENEKFSFADYTSQPQDTYLKSDQREKQNSDRTSRHSSSSSSSSIQSNFKQISSNRKELQDEFNLTPATPRSSTSVEKISFTSKTPVFAIGSGQIRSQGIKSIHSNNRFSNDEY